MLPSSGYFQTINCPFYDSGLCDRSYCHYRHVKKDATNPSKDCGSAEVTSNSLLGVGDDHNILQQLVSEAVKKALRDTELTSVEGDIGNCSSTGGNEEVSSKLVEKVIEGLKPLVARSPPPLPTNTVSAPIPSYKPTPISELRKRHIPVPYTPKDTKTILVKRQLGDVGCQFAKVKSVSTKRREEYVPGTSGKAVDSEKSSYKPYTLQSYGEVHYSPLDSVVNSEILYTPSDKSSLPTKTSDYVPTGLSDISIPNAFYEPTNRGDSPIQEPEYQPDVGSSSSRLVSYIPSKLDGSKEDTNVRSNSDELDPGGFPDSCSSFLDSKNCGRKNIAEDHTQLVSSTKPFVNSKTKFNLEGSTETLNAPSKGSENVGSDSSSSVQIKSKSESKDRDKCKSSSKHSLHHKDSKNHKNKDGKVHSARRDSKDERLLKDTKHQKENKDQKDLKNHKLAKDNHTLKETKNPEEEFHEKEVSNLKSVRESKDTKDKHKRKSGDEHDSKSKRRRLDSCDGTDSKKKERVVDSSSKTENKHRSEISHNKHNKEKRSSEEKHSTSHSKHSSGTHASHKSKAKLKSESEVIKESRNKPNSSLKKSKTSTSGHCNNKIIEQSKSVKEPSISDLKKKHHTVDSFEEMENLIKERYQEREYSDIYMGDSDTDEDTRTEECLKIFNAYKPEMTQDTEERYKKTTLGDKGPEADSVAPAAKKRLAHEGAALLPKKPLTSKKLFNPAMAMVQRLAKAKEHLSEIQALPSKTIAGKRRIAHVPNVSKLLDAKEKIYAGVQPPKSQPTISQTMSKGSQRVAHVPPKEVTCRPMISSVDGSKIPTNVRQKYCNLMFEELLKKIETEEDCSRLALEEEDSCYSRSSSRNVYVNLAIITIQRLRNFVASKGKDDSSGGSKLTVSHENVIGGKSKAKGLWSIIPPKKLPAVVDESKAYQLFCEKYLLSEEHLKGNGFPRACPTEKGKAILMETSFRSKTKSKTFFERICDRCGKEYLVNEKGLGKPDDQCIFHWGRAYRKRGIGEFETKYSCCDLEARSEGCTVWNCHVSDMFDPENQRGFVQTLEKPYATPGKIFSLDCEMCYTIDGLELTRITVINYDGETVYDTLVKPEKTVLDYITRFSGIDEESMKGVTKTILDVQATLLSMFDNKTILIGHSLDSDFKALKLIHDTVVDTSIVFPHRRGPPFKRALKTLCGEYLQKLIQTGDEGHDSAEDALSCMELMKWKLKEDLKSM